MANASLSDAIKKLKKKTSTHVPLSHHKQIGQRKESHSAWKFVSLYMIERENICMQLRTDKDCTFLIGSFFHILGVKERYDGHSGCNRRSCQNILERRDHNTQNCAHEGTNEAASDHPVRPHIICISLTSELCPKQGYSHTSNSSEDFFAAH